MAEEKVRESEAKYHTLFEKMNEGFSVCKMIRDEAGSVVDMVYLEMNPAVERQTGLNRETFIGHRLSEIFTKGDLDNWLPVHAKVADSNEPLTAENYAEYTDRWYESIEYRTGVDELSILFHDITERKHAEEALRESERDALALVSKLEEADRNKNQFISVLSHELRNPLAAISAGVQILDITQDNRQIEKVKEVIKRQTNQLCKMVEDLLELTRISQNKIKLKKENINLNEVIKSAVDDIKHEYEKKGVKLGTKIQTKSVLLSADPVRITQAIGNILFNALKFTQAKGTVWLTLKTEKNNAVISVKDNGIGMSPEMLTNLFTPFTQADATLDRTSGGLGLGLSIVKGIVELHEGNVNAFSEGLGKGSTFTIRLPISAEDNLIMEKTIPVDGEKKSLKLLIIEDNKDFADLMDTMLTTIGYQVKVSYNGHEGVEKAKQFRPDIIFCDIGMPGMDGFEVAKVIKKSDDIKNALLVALTGYTGQDHLKFAKESGFERHLAKPVTLAAVQQLLNGCKGEI